MILVYKLVGHTPTIICLVNWDFRRRTDLIFHFQVGVYQFWNSRFYLISNHIKMWTKWTESRNVKLWELLPDSALNVLTSWDHNQTHQIKSFQVLAKHSVTIFSNLVCLYSDFILKGWSSVYTSVALCSGINHSRCYVAFLLSPLPGNLPLNWIKEQWNLQQHFIMTDLSSPSHQPPCLQINLLALWHVWQWMGNCN